MTADHDLERRLQNLGSAPGPSPDNGFTDRLDSHLRVMHAQELGASPRRPRWTPAIVGLIAIIAVIFVATLSFDGATSAEVIMTAASDTEVVFPDERSVTGSEGLTLPEGTRIVVGSEGEAIVNGVILGPGSEAVVVAGDHIDVVVTTPVDPPPSDTGARPDDRAAPGLPAPWPSTTGPVPTRSTDPDQPATTTRTAPTTDQADRSTTIGTDETPPTEPGPNGTRPITSTTDAPSTTRSTSPPSTVPATTTTLEGPDGLVTLRATSVGTNRLRLDWVINGDLQPAGWLVQARSGDRISTVAVIRDGATRSATIERSPRVSYLVEALDNSGQVLAVSNPQP